ncbi:MAG: glycosyltransferase family 4 protein [Reyranella sp.]|uniref:glycosyltransferase family 4 protein n=1 Tax=Reyranella sp. TaxID=1929291 RepID=UPI002731E70F|nr:glycosyltransferase family 4 protein [Reyranella sp.]MDP1967472.1 glycosyltransferase family 4 protein [Reyranella sp.]MDP2376450.1 glycosyltransferase family 4 protein [Reyranella sp.]
MVVRVLALVGDCYGGLGGIARYNRDLFEGLAVGGTEILVLPRLGEAHGLALPQGIRQQPAISSRLKFSIAAVWGAWRARPVDVVFCGHVYMAPLAWMLARLFGARYWLQAHGADIWRDRPESERVAIEAADQVTTVSRATRRILLGRTNLAPERVRVLPNTVGDQFVPGPPPEALRARLGLGQGPILLTVGRLASGERYKGHEQIFAALPALRAIFPELVHLVVGEGDDRARLEARAAELAPAPGVVRFLGFVPDEELPQFYRLADLFVMPSSEEGFGIVYLEAAACGLRVVGGAGGGAADAIPDARVGLIVDPLDRAALIEAIRRSLGQGRVDPAAIEAYRRPHFDAAARLLLARVQAQPCRKRGMP